MSRATSKIITVVFYDGNGNSITAGPGQGDYSIGEIEAGGYEAFVAADRGSNEGWVEGADRVIDFSITVEQPKTDPLEVARWVARAAPDYDDLVSVNDDDTVFTFDLEILHGGVPVHHLRNVRARCSPAEAGAGSPATIAIAGQALQHGFGALPAPE
jgi:hypothetical protein